MTGDATAIEELCFRYRAQLTRMITVRLDPRLKGRLDPSDIVQDVLVEAAQKMASELRDRPVQFYPWLAAWLGIASAAYIVITSRRENGVLTAKSASHRHTSTMNPC